MSWKNKLLEAGRVIDDSIDAMNTFIRRRLNRDIPVHIVPYRTYGTPNRIFVRGRVLEDKGITQGSEEQKMWDNLLNMYKRFESNEVPGAKVRIDFNGEFHDVITDNEGFFVFDLNPVEPLHAEELYHAVPLHLVETPVGDPGFNTLAEIMIPPADAEYGIISDIDDTIIRTAATSLLAMGKTVLLSNARTRLPYAGVSEFYKAMQLGRNGQRNNPFFYVSSSPWNLYDLITDFMDHNQVPGGPLLLRDFGIQSDTFMKGDYLGHKFKEIKRIFENYPKLNFVLVGDSGEEDPVIYHEVVKQFPDRVIAVYIRDVAVEAKRKIAMEMAASLRAFNVEMILTEDSADAARHAASTGLIFTEKVEEVEEEKLKDEGVIEGKEEIGET